MRTNWLSVYRLPTPPRKKGQQLIDIGKMPSPLLMALLVHAGVLSHYPYPIYQRG